MWGGLLLAGLGGAGGFPEYTQQSGKAAAFCEQGLRYEARTLTTGQEADRQLSSHNLLEEGRYKIIMLFGKTWGLRRVAPKLEFIESVDNDRNLT